MLAANGAEVYLFEDLRPTPELSFAIRHLNCDAGIVITASHNPPEYNGYKVYWNDGGQIVPPHDNKIIEEVNLVNFDKINFNANEKAKQINLRSQMDALLLQISKKELEPLIKTIKEWSSK